MSLALDKRQRAMLREMGVRVWQPLHARLADASALESAEEARHLPKHIAIDNVAADAENERAAARFNSKNADVAPSDPGAEPSAPARLAPSPAPNQQPEPSLNTAHRPTPVAQAAAASVANTLAPTQGLWGLGLAQTLYPATGADAEPAKSGARWLVLAEVPGAGLQAAAARPRVPFNPLAGDAGKLLDNMLRAARLNHARSVQLVPLARDFRVPSGQADPATPAVLAPDREPVVARTDIAAALPGCVDVASFDLVLVMGRFAAQALLQTDQPFGKLRGQMHTIGGKPAIVTHDAAYLLRNQADKAKAWDDLRLAMRVAASLAAP